MVFSVLVSISPFLLGAGLPGSYREVPAGTALLRFSLTPPRSSAPAPPFPLPSQLWGSHPPRWVLLHGGAPCARRQSWAPGDKADHPGTRASC